jgi:hypothetical protein
MVQLMELTRRFKALTCRQGDLVNFVWAGDQLCISVQRAGGDGTVEAVGPPLPSNTLAAALFDVYIGPQSVSSSCQAKVCALWLSLLFVGGG